MSLNSADGPLAPECLPGTILAAQAARYRRMTSQPRSGHELGYTSAVSFIWPDGTECRYVVNYQIVVDWAHARPDTPPDQSVEVLRIELDEVAGNAPTHSHKLFYGYAALEVGGLMRAFADAVMAVHVGG